jgi:hypothetical protein
MEAACARALAIGSPSRKSVEMILKSGLDRLPVETEQGERKTDVHENVRGGDYYDTEASPRSPTTRTIH